MIDVRIRFRKYGRAKFISHLDLTRTMTRALRRAQIPVWYTEGFNRHPYLTFASPLSLGFEGMAESMDVRLTEDMPPGEIISRMNRVLPDGLTVYAADKPKMKAGEIAFARYRLEFKENTGRLNDFLNEDGVTVKKSSKKGNVSEIELAPFLKTASCGKCDGGFYVELTLPCGAQTVNPALIVEAYGDYISRLGQQDVRVFCDITRLDLLNADGEPFI